MLAPNTVKFRAQPRYTLPYTSQTDTHTHRSDLSRPHCEPEHFSLLDRNVTLPTEQ